jgi:acetyl-CoA synthetase
VKTKLETRMTSMNSFLQARDFLFAHRNDYDTAYRDFRWPEMDRFNWALDYFDPMAQGNRQTALWIVEEDGRETKLSFAEMAERSNRVANYLRTLGVARGDRILLMLPNHVALWDIMLAAMKLGAVVIPTSTLLVAQDLQDRVSDGGARFVIAIAAEAPKFADVDPGVVRILVAGEGRDGWRRFEDAYDADPSFTANGDTRADDPLLLYFTSGTTSKPKRVIHSHRSYPVGHLSTMYWIGLQPGDLHWNISSPGWAKHAWSCFFAPWNAGAGIFIYNYARFNGKAVLGVLQRYQVTTLCAPPTVWRMLVQEDLKAHPVKLRELVGAGEPLNPEIIARIEAGWGITIRDGYGQTETTCQIGNPPGQPVKAGSMGRPLPGYRIALLDVDGTQSDNGEISLVLDPRPAGLMMGYDGNPEQNANATRGGYYRTSDVASRDADGYITFIGRNDDVFKSSDYRLSPFDLESVLIEHEAVAEAAVVPSPDPVRLTVPKAFIILRAGYEPSRELAQDVLRFCRDRLAPYKRIRRIEFADLPKTISGKIRRVELRAKELQRRDDKQRAPMEFWEEDFPS